ncbi:MAG: hypothetical protein ACKO96_07580, partial [Flammeovirgaceae bacterium]
MDFITLLFFDKKLFLNINPANSFADAMRNLSEKCGYSAFNPDEQLIKKLPSGRESHSFFEFKTENLEALASRVIQRLN